MLGLVFRCADDLGSIGQLDNGLMAVHLQSIWLIGALTAFVYGVLVLLVKPAQPKYMGRALSLTGFSSIVLSFSFLLRSGVPIPFEGMRHIAANTLVPIALGSCYRGIAELKHRSASKAWIYVPTAWVLAHSLWLNFVVRNVTINQLIFNTDSAAMMLAIAVVLRRREGGRIPRADRVASVTFLLLAISTLSVVAAFVGDGSFPREFAYNNPRAVYNMVATVTSASLLYFILLLMIFERLTEELSIQALRDPLTNVYNRRAFEEIAFREISGAVRSGLPLALIVCDIDRFKGINDTYGHVAGDQVLLQAAGILRTNLRDEDTLCRWGGDEFVALLPRAGAEDAESVACRIAQAFERCEMMVNGTPIPVSVSLGIAAGNHLSDDLSTLLNEADRAMYRAKQRFKQENPIPVS